MRIVSCATLLILCACSSEPEPSSDPALRWLFSQQKKDGSWRSDVYDKQLGQGHAYTAMVLHALTFTKDANRDKINKGMEYLRAHLRQKNEYPSYTSALTILVLTHYKPKGWKKDVEELVGILRRRQLTETLGWNIIHHEYGGWENGSELPRHPRAQRTDLSVTAFAVEALRKARVSENDPSLKAARLFTERCSNKDGGYFFTPHFMQDNFNKAGKNGDQFRSYGTATCDALRILTALKETESAASARAWLVEHSPVTSLGGFPSGAVFRDRARALSFYYYYAQSRVRPSRELQQHVLSLRNGDGFWVNDLGLMKEDDPIIATALAIVASRRE